MPPPPSPRSAAPGDSIHEGLPAIWAKLDGDFGLKFVRFLIVVYFGIKGLSLALLRAAMLPIFQHLGIGGNRYQLAGVVAGIPWAAKGWIGVLSDCFPLGQYHKRGYMLLSSALGTVGVLALLAASQLQLKSGMCWPVAVAFMLVNLQYSTYDLLSEGKYAELMRERGAGSEVLSLIWVCINLGALLSAVLVFGFIDVAGPAPLLALTLVPSLLGLTLVARGDLPEERARSWKVQHEKMMSQPKLFLLAFYMALGVVVVGIVAAMGSHHTQLVVTLAVAVSLSWCSFKALPRTLARSNLFMMIQQAACIDLSGVLAYYYTAGPNCVPDGPHFSYTYYLSVSSFVAAVGGGLGSVLFQGMRSWSFRSAFCMATMVQVVASLFDLVIVQRWNVMVGLSDKATYLFGDAACQQMAAMLGMMPMALLTSRLCPRGAEATVYALLAGFQNFGSAVASVVGVWLTTVLGIKTSAGVNEAGMCDFSQLSFAIVLAHVVAPLLGLGLSIWLVPVARINDEAYFELASPPPSFCSAPGSPATPACTSDDSDQQDSYQFMDDAEVLEQESTTGGDAVQIVMTWGRQPSSQQ